MCCATQDSDKVPNNPPTAASCTYTPVLFSSPVSNGCCTDGADLNGMAVLNACQQIQERLQPLIDRYPELSGPANFANLCNAAYFERINLMANGFYASPHGAEYQWPEWMDTDDNSARGDAWNYFAFGVGCAEVEVDCLTGVWRAVRCDVIMDVGQSLNAAIDIGESSDCS